MLHQTITLAFVATLVAVPALYAGTSERPCPDWGMYGRSLERTFSTECSSPISPETAAMLVPKWVVKTRKTVTASPAVADGRVFVGDWAGWMYAFDAETGNLLWEYETPPAPGAAFGPIVSSAAVSDVEIAGEDRTIVVFGSGPNLYALDAADGSLVWRLYVGALDVDLVEVESSPLVWNDIVFVGMDPHNHPASETGGVRGGVLAVDARTGSVHWKFEPDPQGLGCDGVWSSPTLDVSRRQVYFGTASCPSDVYDPVTNPWGPHIEAVTALSLADDPTDPPSVAWTFQPDPTNHEDWDFGATANLFVAPDGREILGIGKKSGVYYALDPSTGALVWERGVVSPGDVPPNGGNDFSIGGFIGSTAVWQGRVFGGTAIGGPPYYHSLDGRDGEIVWQDPATLPSYAASAIVNGVVFHGALDDLFRAYDAASGRLLWVSPLLGPISSGPAIVGDSVYVGSGTSSSDACAKPSDDPLSEAFFETCLEAFDEGLGRTGGVHAFRLAVDPGREPSGGLLFNGQDNQLDQYDLSVERPGWSVFLPNAANGGKDLNAQICSFEQDGRAFLVLGEDTGQTNGVPQGWGVFDLESRVEVGKLIADYAPTVQPEQYGCAVETDGAGSLRRLFVSQVGGGSFSSGDGQLIVFFPTSPALDAALGRAGDDDVCPGGDCTGLTTSDSDACILDDDVRTAGGMAMDAEGNVYLVEAAPTIPPEIPGPGRVLRYRPPFPPSAEGCFPVEPEVFIESILAASPGAIVAARDRHGDPTGHWYVSSVLFPPVVNEYDEKGRFVRIVVPPGFGTPFGLAVGPDGTLYYADIGIVFDPADLLSDPARLGFGPGAHEGAVYRVRFAHGVPKLPELLRGRLEFPDGLGVVD